MSACPAACKLDGVEGERTGWGESALPFSSPSTLATLRRALPSPLPSPLCAERALDAVSFTSHRNHATAISGTMYDGANTEGWL